jgi:hypothetical protein
MLADTRSGIQGIVYALDIGQVMGSDKMPSCKETDYEQWTVPADDHTPRCLLGELSHHHVSVVCDQAMAMAIA